MASERTVGHLAESNASAQYKQGIQAYRGVTHLGLKTRPIGRWTFQVTGGTADPGVNTLDLTVGGVSIMSGPIDWITSHSATAEDIADAINAEEGDFYATVSTDTVTIYQVSSGAVTIVKAEAGDATGTLSAAFASSDDFTEFVGGATFDGDEHYELFWDPTLIRDASPALTDALLLDLSLYCDGQAWQYWIGGVRTASNVIVQGIPVATATWETIEWLGAQSGPFVIKIASDEELIVKAKYL